MTERLLLMDSDVFVLLSAAGLLDELVEALGFTRETVRCLPALPHQLARGRQFRRFPEPFRQMALDQCRATATLNNRPQDNELFGRLVAVDDIDEGEALLLASLAEQPACLLMTGDRRSIIALATADGLDDIRDKVRGRILALESALTLLVRNHGATTIGSRFATLKGCHSTIDVLFAHKTAFDDEQSLAEIASYLNDLLRQIGDDLLFPL